MNKILKTKVIVTCRCALSDLYGYALDFDINLEKDDPTAQTIRELKELLTDLGEDVSDYE